MTRAYSRSFTGGELTGEFFGQIADAKYQTGLALCRNFRILPHGPAQNRAGFEFVREVKDSTKATRLIPFEYSTTQTMVLELGDGYMRFHSQGATLLVGTPGAWSNVVTYAPGTPVSYLGTNYVSRPATVANVNHPPSTSPTWWYPIPSAAYEIPTVFASANLWTLRYVQSADVMTLVSTLYPSTELKRFGALNWTMAPIVFASTLAAPTNLGGTANFVVGSTLTDHVYAATSVGANNIDESAISATQVTLQNNLFDSGAYNDITWTAAQGALRYNVYKKSNGLWGYIGQASGTTFRDDNITPDLTKTPPEVDNPFAGTGNYPGAVTYFEQRRCFAGTINKPQNLWLTRSGTESNLSYSIPTRDSDAISFRVAARQANTVQHLVPMNNLLALTSSAEWRVTSVNTDALTPTSISVKPQSFIGANAAQPVIVNSNVIYAAARGGHAREMAYNWQAAGYITGDLSLRAPHLFDGLSIIDIAFSKAPYPIVWMVSSSGKLLGLTYVPEQQIGAWHWHDTDGAFESCCVVAEGDEDVLYAVVRRAIGGVQKRYIERMRPRAWATAADAFHVDSGQTYSGAPATVISGLDHLEGKTVSILADAAVVQPQVVTGGQITLAQPAGKVHAGLQIVADLQTLPLALEIPGFGQGMRKNVNKVFLRVKDSSGIFTGPAFDELTEAKIRTTEPYGSPPALQTREIEIVNKAAWTDSAQVCVRQADPLPLTIVSLTLDLALGG